MTNGLRLAYPALVDRLVAHRLRYVYLSLHGGSRKVHNLMVLRRTVFEKQWRAGELSVLEVETYVDWLADFEEATSRVLPFRLLTEGPGNETSPTSIELEMNRRDPSAIARFTPPGYPTPIPRLPIP